MIEKESLPESGVVSETIRGLLDEGKIGVLATMIGQSGSGTSEIKIGAKLIVEESGAGIGSLGNEDLDQAVARQAGEFLKTREEARIFRVAEFDSALTDFRDLQILFERIEAEPRLVIAGAGHVGASLARLAALVGYRVTLIDDRPEFVARERFNSKSEQEIELVSAADWRNAIREAIGNGRGVSVAIVTRGHKQDEDCLRATIAARPDYIGMIGSKRRTNIVLDKLSGEGIDERILQSVHAPIGLDIGAVSPEEVALAILSEIVGV